MRDVRVCVIGLQCVKEGVMARGQGRENVRGGLDEVEGRAAATASQNRMGMMHNSSRTACSGNEASSAAAACATTARDTTAHE